MKRREKEVFLRCEKLFNIVNCLQHCKWKNNNDFWKLFFYIQTVLLLTFYESKSVPHKRVLRRRSLTSSLIGTTFLSIIIRQP
jgi:predicted ATPase